MSFNTVGSAANLTGGILFDRLHINAEKVFINNSIALEKMRTGEIAGVVHVTGKPTDLFTKFKPEPGFHFLPVPFTPNLQDYYVPTELTSTDYPNLIPAGESVETIAVPQVLAVYNWPPETDRYRRVARFVEYFFNRFDQFQKPPFHPKWKEINLASRFPAGPGFEPQKSCWQSRRKRGSAINQTVHTLALVKTRTIARSSISFAAGKRRILPGDRLVLDDRFHENDHMGGRHLIPV